MPAYCKMVSIVVLTLNSRDSIRLCLDSVFGQRYRDFEVIVVDNGSGDSTPELVKKYPKTLLIENKENFGACRARNQGIEASNGEWILTLDCDVVLEKDFLSKAVNVIDSLSLDTGILQPKILNFDKRTIYSCGIHLSRMRRFYDIGRGRDSKEFSGSKSIFGACSACAFYKKQMLRELKEETGYFDERFFFLVEDVDLAWRAQKKSWKTLFYPEGACYHSGNSSGTKGKLRQYFCFRNRYLMIFKNEARTGILRFWLFFMVYDFPRLFYLLLTNNYVLREAKETIISKFSGSSGLTGG